MKSSAQNNSDTDLFNTFKKPNITRMKNRVRELEARGLEILNLYREMIPEKIEAGEDVDLSMLNHKCVDLVLEGVGSKYEIEVRKRLQEKALNE